MRLAALALASFVLVACGGSDPGGRAISRSPADDVAASGSQPGATSAPAAAPATCPTDVPAATKLASAADATDLAIVGDDVWLRTSTSVGRIAKGGAGAIEAVYTSADLATAFIDATGIFTVESPDPPNAVLKFIGLDGKVQQTVTPDNWNANGTRVFGADAANVYVLADDGGDTIYRVDRATGALTKLADLGDPLSDPQLVGTDVWFVRAQRRVYKVAQTDVDGTLTAEDATEVFASGSDDCRLAVGGGAAYCSNGKSLVRRDTSGAGLTTLFDASASLGAPIFSAGALVMRPITDAGNATPMKNVIASLVPKTTTADEKIAACGRPAIGAVAADAKSVVWSEPTGLYIAPR